LIIFGLALGCSVLFFEAVARTQQMIHFVTVGSSLCGGSRLLLLLLHFVHLVQLLSDLGQLVLHPPEHLPIGGSALRRVLADGGIQRKLATNLEQFLAVRHEGHPTVAMFNNNYIWNQQNYIE